MHEFYHAGDAGDVQILFIGYTAGTLSWTKQYFVIFFGVKEEKQ